MYEYYEWLSSLYVGQSDHTVLRRICVRIEIVRRLGGIQTENFFSHDPRNRVTFHYQEITEQQSESSSSTKEKKRFRQKLLSTAAASVPEM